MRWWYRWRAKVWGMRLFYAKARLESIQDWDSPDYIDAVCEHATAASAVLYYSDKIAKT